jgi:hypothetical protein
MLGKKRKYKNKDALFLLSRNFLKDGKFRNFPIFIMKGEGREEIEDREQNGLKVWLKQ